METVAQNIQSRFRVKTRIIIYDFSALSCEGEATNLEKILSDSTKDIDVSVLVNNVGMATAAPFHKVGLQKVF
jgi:short-subunit dehydrogenase